VGTEARRLGWATHLLARIVVAVVVVLILVVIARL